MAKDLVRIPKAEYEKLLGIKASFEEIGSFFVQPNSKLVRKKNDEHLRTEDFRLYKPAFVRQIKRTLKEVAEGKGRVITSLSDL